MKKLLCFILAVTMLLSLVACVKKETPPVDENETENTEVNDKVPDETDESDETDKTSETPDESDETPDETVETPDKSDEQDETPDEDYKKILYFYKYRDSQTDYIWGTDKKPDEAEFEALYTYGCKNDNARSVSTNKNFAYIYDGTYFFYEFESGETFHVPTDIDRERVYFSDQNCDYVTLINSSWEYALFDIRKQEFLTDYYHYLTCIDGGKYILVHYEQNYHIIRLEDMKELFSTQNFVDYVTVSHTVFGDCDLFLMKEDMNSYTYIGVYNSEGVLIHEKPFSKYSLTSGGELITAEKETDENGNYLSGHFSIYDGEMKQRYQSRDYENVITVAGDFAVVREDGMYKFMRRDEEVSFPICEVGNTRFHHLIGGYKSETTDATKMFENEYAYETGYEANVGDAQNPRFEAVENPSTLPAAYYYIVENYDLEYGKPGYAYEYVIDPENGVLGRIVMKGVGGYAKPVLYLYPEEETDFTVTFERPETLTVTYPKYISEWSGTVAPDGTITDARGRTYYSLYWEESAYVPADFRAGFCVHRDDCAAFLEDALARLGLTEREANEFIIYWLPEMEKNEYTLVHFELTEEREAYNGLNITPKPDSLLRIAMHIKSCDTFVPVVPQYLPTFERVGFTAVEWGGARER